MRDIDELLERLCDDYLEQVIAKDRRSRQEARSPIGIGPEGEPEELPIGSEAANWYSHLGESETEHAGSG